MKIRTGSGAHQPSPRVITRPRSVCGVSHFWSPSRLRQTIHLGDTTWEMPFPCRRSRRAPRGRGYEFLARRGGPGIKTPSIRRSVSRSSGRATIAPKPWASADLAAHAAASQATRAPCDRGCADTRSKPRFSDGKGDGCLTGPERTEPGASSFRSLRPAPHNPTRLIGFIAPSTPAAAARRTGSAREPGSVEAPQNRAPGALADSPQTGFARCKTCLRMPAAPCPGIGSRGRKSAAGQAAGRPAPGRSNDSWSPRQPARR